MKAPFNLMNKVNSMGEFNFSGSDGGFSLKCIVPPTYIESSEEGSIVGHYIAIAEDDNSSIISDNHMLDAIFEFDIVEHDGEKYKVHGCEYPSNVSYKDSVNKDIKCMILLSLEEI